MIKREFELSSKAKPGDKNFLGFYNIECDDPKVSLRVTDMAVHPNAAREDEEYGRMDDLPCKEFNVTDGEGYNYHYFIEVSEVKSSDVPYQELQSIVEDCWDWFLSGFLL